MEVDFFCSTFIISYPHKNIAYEMFLPKLPPAHNINTIWLLHSPDIYICIIYKDEEFEPHCFKTDSEKTTEHLYKADEKLAIKMLISLWSLGLNNVFSSRAIVCNSYLAVSVFSLFLSMCMTIAILSLSLGLIV